MPAKRPASNWKPLQLDGDIFTGTSVEGLIGIEELTDYNVEDYRRKRRKKVKNDSEDTAVEVVETPNSDSKVANKKKKKRGSGKAVSARGWSVTDTSEEPEGEEEVDMSPWKNLFVPAEVTRALEEMHFTQPTQIQALTLPPAIMGKKDILGAAETGSGKTLAFGIPIIHGILEYRDRVEKGLENENDESSDEESDEELNEGVNVGCVKVVNLGEVKKHPKNKKLHALILTPTRELAIQVKNHLVAATKYCGITVATVVGGMSQEKQERMLRKGPEIVVATPGRLWELVKEGNDHLQQVDDLKYLVIDEADRMMEKGHFQELKDLLERMQTLGNKKNRPQILVFSATLTLVHEPPARLKQKVGVKKKPLRQTPGQKLQELITILGMEKPKVIDVTAEQCTAGNLTEAFIPCSLEEKDAHLYSFLLNHAGRTLVFCNSVSCVRRLVQLFTLLQCRPGALHAQMAQRQRLKNLDRFAEDPAGLLLATDVAARGLDIRGVQHVIHYQVPRTSEGYVHRSGRTARGHNEGLTVMLVEPKDVPNYSRLCRTLGRDSLPEFPVDGAMFQAVQTRVQAARKLEGLEHTQRRINSEEGWVSKAAKEMDLHFDEHDRLPIKGSNDADTNRSITMQQKALRALLKQPLMKRGSLKYPTASGELKVPFAVDSTLCISFYSQFYALSFGDHFFPPGSSNAVQLVKTAKKPLEKRQLGAALGFVANKRKKFKQRRKKKSA